MFISKTPDNVDELSAAEIIQIATDAEGMPSGKVRYRIIQMLFDVLGFSLSNDALLMLISEPPAKLCLSTAGGGKTTSANIQILAEKIMRKSRRDPGKGIPGSKILCLVYNRHNVADFYNRHKMLVGQLQCANIKGLDIDNELQVTTMHAFCEMWRRQYAVECDLVGFKVVQGEQSAMFMKSASNIVFEKYKIKGNASSVDNLCSIYTYKQESMMSYEELSANDKFIDLHLPIQALREIFQLYESIKRRRRVYDFTDMLTKIYELLLKRKDILERIQKFYEYVVVDEVQDFTPLMMELLRLFVNNGTPVLCIGDEDQSIYGFRGADIYNTLHFSDKFPGGEVFLLNRNRRCGRKIIEAASKIINKNAMRYKKRIGVVREGGDIQYVPYLTTEGQLLNVIGKLKEMDIRELQETVACCREREGSQILTQLLAENRIAHHVISGYQAYSHELYRHMMDVLYVLYRPMDAQVQLNLYKVLPVMKEALYEILQYNEKKGVFLDTKERKHFAQIDYGRFLAHSGFKEVITELLQMSQSIGTAPMRGYVPRLFTLLKKYYWNWKKQYNSCIERDEFFEKRVLTYFSADCTFSEFLDQHSRNKQFCATNQNNQRGLAVSTFHGLKGLEFDTVFMINLDNDIFPNYSLIDSKDYPEQVKQQLKEAEVRLFYVALTRARDTLYLYYQQNNPSSYVKDLLGASYQENHLVYDVDNLKDTGLPAVEEEDDLSFLLEDDDEEEVSLLGDTAIEVGACSTGNVDEFRQDENGGDEMRRMVNSGDEMERDRTSGLQFSNSFMEKMLSNF